ncbi:hypothetical protein ACFE04_027766 [Oxalis oulophora]
MHLGVLATASHIVTSLKVDWVDSKWRSLKVELFPKNQASSPFWYHGSAHSQEITQFGGTVEVQSNENPVAWLAKPKKKPISAIGEGMTRRDHLVEKWNMFNLLLCISPGLL